MREENKAPRKSVKRKMSESNRVGFLKKSKKYATGVEYNTLEGRIKIVNRYLENGEIMIAYLLNGEVISKSELDVNTMLYKYAREVAQNPSVGDANDDEDYTISDLKDDVNELIEVVKSQQEKYEQIIDKQFELIKALMEANKKEG